MRIISGKYRGRKLNPPSNLPLRPTTDMAREALFNILNNYYDFEEIRVLDLFCGTGAISFEFASRGCNDVTAVDTNPRCLDFIKKTCEQFGEIGIHSFRADVFRFVDIQRPAWDIIFADPPYAMKESVMLPGLIFANGLLREGGRLIIEHPADISFKETEGFIEQRSYSRVQFSFFGYNPPTE